MVECFWCDTFYNETVEDKCPNCLSKIGSPVAELTQHAPRDLPLSDAPRSWRRDIKVMERICVHGVGHPDPELEYEGEDAVHSCDGCCWSETP